MGNIILLLVWDSTNEQGKSTKKRRGVKTVKEEKKRIPNLFLIMEKKQKLLKVLCCLRSFFINYSYLIIKGK